MAEVGQSPPTPTAAKPLGSKISTTLTQQEQITVWGRKKRFFPAPMADNRILEPQSRSSFGPGSKLGPATIEGGPVSDQIHSGVSGGIAIPVSGVKGLDFTVTATGSQDAMTASGTNGTASATTGFRLKF